MHRKDLLAYARDRVGLKIVPWETEIPGLLSLTRRIYPGSDIGDPRYIDWQYKQNPAGEACCQVGKLDDQVVGAFSIVPIRHQIFGRDCMGSIPVNLMADPHYRGLGVFPLLADSVLQAARGLRIDFTMGLPNPMSIDGFIQDLDFREIGHFPLWVFPINISALAKIHRLKSHPLLRTVLRAMGPLATASRVIHRTLWRRAPVDTEEVRGVDHSFDLFWEKVRNDYPNAVVRDQRYLQWRFLDHPTRKYRLSVARKGQRMSGYLVERVDEIMGIRSGVLVDLLVEKSPDGRIAAQELVREATLRFVAQGVAIAVALLPEQSPAAGGLRRIGYWRCPGPLLPQPFHALARWDQQDPPAPGLYDLKSWYLTLGDYDGV